MIIPVRPAVRCEVFHNDRWQKALFTHRKFKTDPDTLDWIDDLVIEIIATGEQIIISDIARLRIQGNKVSDSINPEQAKLALNRLEALVRSSKTSKTRT